MLKLRWLSIPELWCVSWAVLTFVAWTMCCTSFQQYVDILKHLGYMPTLLMQSVHIHHSDQQITSSTKLLMNSVCINVLTLP